MTLIKNVRIKTESTILGYTFMCSYELLRQLMSIFTQHNYNNLTSKQKHVAFMCHSSFRKWPACLTATSNILSQYTQFGITYNIRIKRIRQTKT